MRNNKAMYFHYTEWVMNHPRFAILMAILICLSLTNSPWLAVILFVLFSIEIGHRIALIIYRSRLNPYKVDMRRKMELMFLLLDIIAVASLLVTVFQSSIPIEGTILARFIRILYLLRAVRLFRYLDMQSALSSPTYGMLISLIVIVSFFAEGMYLWVIFCFFTIELCVRFIIMKNMRFATGRKKAMEWFFWWLDLIATAAILPMFATSVIGSALRMLRLTRLVRPWMTIIRNLVAVIREGQFMQEINLILLILAVLSISGGYIGELIIDNYDFTRDGIINAQDNAMLARIWFAFRAFSDPGNVVYFPETDSIALFSVLAVVAGVFIFAFFIGIGASIVSGLMAKLRNSNLNIANHMVMLGWNDCSPFVVQQLRMLSNRTFSRLKLVLLNEQEKQPKNFGEETWVTYRWGDMEDVDALKRINLAAARQVIVNVPDHQSASQNLAHSFFSLLAIRDENPEIYINYATPGLSTPHLKVYHHQLQVGWDKKDFYNKPTVILSQADVKANLFRQIMHYPDFDQVVGRLMVPVRHDESSLQIIDWSGSTSCLEGVWNITSADGNYRLPVKQLVSALFRRGVILIALSDVALKVYGITKIYGNVDITHLIGIALDANSLRGEMDYVIRHPDGLNPADDEPVSTHLVPLDSGENINILIIGRIDAQPLMLKRLLNSYDKIDVTIIDDLNREEHIDQLVYLRRRIGEMQGAEDRISTRILRWSFSDMDYLRSVVQGVDRIILSRPVHVTKRPHAVVSNVLSHLVTILDELNEKPYIFPVVDSRNQAMMLQKELNKFDVEHEIHVVVPNEFYGTYVAHTSFGMFSAKSEAIYNSQRVLRYVINDLMADVDDQDIFDLDTLQLTEPLPDSLPRLFNTLLEQNYLLIGYRLNKSFERTDSVYENIFKLFPREDNFRCLRQMHLVINPFGSAALEKSWQDNRHEIIELIVIRIL